MTYRIGVDIGGTFTDLSLLDEASSRVVATYKLPSRPADAVGAVVDGVQALLDDRPVEEVRTLLHGTTVGLNALLAESEPPPVLLTTEGFRDVYELGRQWRGDRVYDLFLQGPKMLLPRWHVLEVPERVDARGEIVRPLDDAAAAALVDQVVALGVRSVAIALLFAFANPAHERLLGRLFRERAPELHVSLSSEVSPEFREYERTATTVANAYLGPRMARYVSRFARRAPRSAARRAGADHAVQRRHGRGGHRGAGARPYADVRAGSRRGGEQVPRRPGRRARPPDDRRGRHELRHGGAARRAGLHHPVDGRRSRHPHAQRRHPHDRERRRQHRLAGTRPCAEGRTAERRRGARPRLLRARRDAPHAHRCPARAGLPGRAVVSRRAHGDPYGARPPGYRRPHRRAAGHGRGARGGRHRPRARQPGGAGDAQHHHRARPRPARVQPGRLRRRRPDPRGAPRP